MRHPSLGLVVLVLTLVTPSALAAKKIEVTVSVDCTDPDPKKHDSIAEALLTPGDKLTIELAGICREDVLIERDDVTLIGSDPAVDGIQAVDTESIRGAAVYVRNARFVRFENLTLTGATHAGARIVYCDTVVEIVNCRLEGNGNVGVTSNHSVVSVQSSLVRDNPRGLAAFGGQLFCDDCTLEATGIGVLALGGSQVALDNSTVDAAGWGLAVFGGPPGIDVENTTITSPSFALLAGDGGQIQARTSTFSGSVYAEFGSLLELRDSEQTTNPLSFNYLDLDSTLRLTPGSTLVGPTFLDNFSQAVLATGSTLDGDLHCSSGSDASCDDAATQVTGGSSCGLCM